MIIQTYKIDPNFITCVSMPVEREILGVETNGIDISVRAKIEETSDTEDVFFLAYPEQQYIAFRNIAYIGTAQLGSGEDMHVFKILDLEAMVQ